MGAVLKGGDPDIVLLLPSGFAILPDGKTNLSVERASLFNQKVTDKACATTTAMSGSLLTVAFQILVDHVPSAKLSLESVATVNNLISSTVYRIKNVVVKE
jgi:homeobox-leucine zipper protein